MTDDDAARVLEYRERAARCRAEAARYWFRRDRIEQLLTSAWVMEMLADQIDGASGASDDPDAIFRQE